jgi:hypothetical protein
MCNYFAVTKRIKFFIVVGSQCFQDQFRAIQSYVKHTENKIYLLVFVSFLIMTQPQTRRKQDLSFGLRIILLNHDTTTLLYDSTHRLCEQTSSSCSAKYSSNFCYLDIAASLGKSEFWAHQNAVGKKYRLKGKQ